MQDDTVKEQFEVDNPTLTQAEAEARGYWWFLTLPTGMIAFIAMLVIVVTALPVLRRRSYNVFYYLHVVLSAFIFILLSFHASTDFYFLLPGLLLWIGDWVWRLFRGMGGLRKRVSGRIENAGDGWYRISLPVSAKLDNANDDVESAISEKRMPSHPLQSYFLVFPAVSKIQNHAFTAAKVGDLSSGPTFLFQRASGKKQAKLDKEWTWKLGSQVNDASDATNDLEVRVEGPYIPSVPSVFTASDIACVVGGTGLTGAYSIALWWLKTRASIEGQRITLVWTIRHRGTANIREWQELQRTVEAHPRFRLILQVTSEEGRLDTDHILRESLAVVDAEKESTAATGPVRSIWVYLSGPEGLLQAGESACLRVQKEIRGGKLTGVASFDFYSAKWEV